MNNINQRTGTIVLTHAAWFDGSSWNKVTAALQDKGYDVVSVQIPLTSLSEDVAAVRRALARVDGPVVLAGHSYGGAVITAAGAGDKKVKGLVYIAAIVPDAGETVGAIFQREASHPEAPTLQPDENGLLWVDLGAFENAISPDAGHRDNLLLNANQRPISVNCLGETLPSAAWREKPSWFLIVENDRMFSPETQRFLAKRMSSKVTSIKADHAPLITRPEAVIEIIEAAASVVLGLH
ncbi:MAG TPA: alpha/beta hydrolase [Gammaproteobacteria bacterium]|nr:alpha/beta hydrolase [Gammaproteobacteria bacterium]